MPRAFRERTTARWAEIRADSAALIAYRPRYSELRGAPDAGAPPRGRPLRRRSSARRSTRSPPPSRTRGSRWCPNAGHMLHAEAHPPVHRAGHGVCRGGGCPVGCAAMAFDTGPRITATGDERPTAVVVAVQLPDVTDEPSSSSSMAELERLAKTLGLDPVGRITQRRAQASRRASCSARASSSELASWTGGTGIVRGVRRSRVAKKRATTTTTRTRSSSDERRSEDDTPTRCPPAEPPRAREGRPRRSRPVADAAAQPREGDRRRRARSHERDPRDLPSPREDPRGAPAGRDRAAALPRAAPARERRRRRSRARRRRRQGRRRELARARSPPDPRPDRRAHATSCRRSRAARRSGASAAASCRPSRSSATRTPASRR